MRANLWKLSTLLLVGALTVVVGRGAIASASAEPQPEMVAALGRLEAARERLEAASHDKGGHRVKALAATKEAIAEVKAGIAYDNQH